MEQLNEAVHLMKQNKLEEVAKILNDMIEQNPDDPLGYINFGQLLIQTNHLDEAIRFLKRAIELDQKAATAYYGLGTVYYKQENFNEAKDHFHQAVQLGLEDSDAYYMLGMSLFWQDQFVHAVPYLLRATELDKEDVQKAFQYGLTLAKCNYIKEAKEVFKGVLEKDPSFSDAHYNLGIIATYEDQHEKALKYFVDALSCQPDHLLAANGKKQVEKLLRQNNE